jgi:hypothetical protein
VGRPEEQDKERPDFGVALSQLDLSGRKDRWEGSKMEELCMRDEVEAVELLFVKIEYRAFRGTALRP